MTESFTPRARFERAARLLAAVAVLFGACASIAHAQTSGALSSGPAPAASSPNAAPPALTLHEALDGALARSSDVASAVADWQSAQERALAAQLQLLPSVSVSGSYTRLSSLPATSLDFPFPKPIGPVTVTLPAAPQDAYSFEVSVRYPIFAGGRLLEAAKIAGLQSTGKRVGIAAVRNALAFEVQRAYWEAVRANVAVATAQKNLDLVGVLLQQVKDEADQGLATPSSVLSAEDGYNQARAMLNDALAGRDEAFLALASLLGQDSVGARLAAEAAAGRLGDAGSPYDLTTSPTDAVYPALAGALDADRLVAEALANRPEAQEATIGVETARNAATASLGAVAPTLALIGDYSYANPNPRVFPATAEFTGTWDVGVALSLDVGKLPSNVAGALSGASEVSAAEAHAAAARTSVVLDVRRSLVAFERAKQDVAMTKSAVSQAEENLRVANERLAIGLAKHSDALQAELALLRVQYAVTGKEVDEQIAAADLARAVALPAAD